MRHAACHTAYTPTCRRGGRAQLACLGKASCKLGGLWGRCNPDYKLRALIWRDTAASAASRRCTAMMELWWLRHASFLLIPELMMALAQTDSCDLVSGRSDSDPMRP